MVSIRNTKKEILDALHTVNSIVTETERERAEVQAKNGSGNAKKLRAVKEGDITKKIEDNGKRKSIASFRQDVHQDLLDLEKRFTIAEEGLGAIQEMIGIKTEYLKKIRDIDANAETLDAILVATREYEANAELKKQALILDYEEKKRILQANFERDTKELELLYKRLKEEFEYNHRKDIGKKKDEAEQAEIVQKRNLEAYKVQCEDMLKKRQAEIDSKEAEYAELNTVVESFPQELETAVSEAVKKAVDSEKRSRGFEISGNKSKHDAEVSVLNTKLEAITERKKELDTQIADLQQKLGVAYEKNTALASSAIEASGSQKVVVNTSETRAK